MAEVLVVSEVYCGHVRDNWVFTDPQDVKDLIRERRLECEDRSDYLSVMAVVVGHGNFGRDSGGFLIPASSGARLIRGYDLNGQWIDQLYPPVPGAPVVDQSAQNC